MKTVPVTRERIVKLKEHFEAVSAITPEAGGTFNEPCPHCGKDVVIIRVPEPMGKVQTFKWRAGRNAQKCDQVARSFAADLARINAATPALEAFFAEQDELFKRFGKRDEKGDLLAANPDGSIPVDESRADEIRAEMRALKEKHAKAMRDREASDAATKAYMAEEVPLEVLTVNANDLPRKLAGDWMVAIAEMINGLPTQVGE